VLHRFRTSLGRLSAGPVLEPAATSDPSMTAAPRPLTGRLAQLVVIGLAIAGVLPPLAFAAHSGDLGQVGAVPISIALIGLLILAPALVGMVTALVGVDGVRESFRLRGDNEHEQAVLRVFVAAGMLAYGFAVGASVTDDAAASCQIVASLALAAAWALLVLAIIDPLPSLLRQCLATIADAALLSAYLHFAADVTAPWFALYLLATFYAGFRLGTAPLATAAIASLAGFTATVFLTPFWRHQPMLSGGLIAALIALPAYIGAMVRVVAASRAEAVAAQAARTRYLTVISQALRAPLDAMVGAAPGQDGREAASSAQALLSQVNSVLDFSAIEAGAFVPSVEAFDLHAVVNDTLADRHAQAAAKGLKLRPHVDPVMPYRLRGWPRQLGQIIDYLVARAIDATDDGVVRIILDSVESTDQTLRLRITVRDDGTAIAPVRIDALFDPFAAVAGQAGPGAAEPNTFGLAVARRLAQLMGGHIAVDSVPGRGGSFTAEVPLAIDEPAVDGGLDLHHCDVLIATEDSQFASDLAEPLNAWHGDPRWIEGFDRPVDIAGQGVQGAPTVLIIDGRHRKLAALSFAHRAVTGPAPPSFALFVAEASQIAGLIELADGELDCILPAPLGNQLLANALHALPLWRVGAVRPTEAVNAAGKAEHREAAIGAVASIAELAPSPVTPIAAHPRFTGDTPLIEPRTISALRELGDGDDFLGEIIDSFRGETNDIMQRIAAAAASVDSPAFAHEVQALRSCSVNLGGARLCELLLSLREIGTDELGERGDAIVRRIGDELARLDAALLDFLPERLEALR
jgi:signal transduction histidine kinase